MHRTSDDIEFKGELNQKLYEPYNMHYYRLEEWLF